MARDARRTRRIDPGPEAAPAPRAEAGAWPGWTRLALPSLLVIGLTGAVYAPVREAEFVNYDDYHYVVENTHVASGLTARNVAWAFPAFAAGNWHPLTWLSHQLDCQLFGLDPGPQHVVSVVFHAANAVLVLLVLFSMTGAVWRSAFVAALFAVHPLNVESVAWISERKNVLSTFFWLLTLLAYAAWVRRPSRARFAAVAGLLALGLMSKPMVVTLPCVLLLMDYWPLGRWDPDRPGARVRALELLREKIPLFALSAASSVLTFAAQKGAGAVTTFDQVTLDARITNAVTSYARYLGKLVWPARLSVFYPHPGRGLPLSVVALAAVLLAGLSVLAWRARRARYLAVGWLWYLGTMVPVIGLVQVGSQAMADRYAYVPLLGPFVAIVWGLAELVGPAGPALAAAGVAVVAGLAVAAHTQAGYWHDSIALFEHARSVTSRNYVAYTNLGLAYNKQKRWDEAIADFRRAIEIQPGSAEAYGHMGLALAKLGRVDEAIAALGKALEIYPQSLHAHNNLGVALRKRDPDAAIDHLRKAIALDPEFPEARVNLGAVLLEKGQDAEARRAFAEAEALDPGSAATHFRIGSVWLEKGDLAAASQQIEAALARDPKHADAHNSLGVVRLRQGRLDAAIAEFRTTLTLEPEHADAHSNLGTALVRQGQAKQGIDELQAALRLNPRHADAHATLGATLAQAGRLEEAIPHFTAAVEADPTSAVAQNNLGAALLQKGDVAGAKEHLIRALDANPRSADAHSNLGIVLLQQGDPRGAAEHFRAALAINPDMKTARSQLEAATARAAR